MSRSVRPAAASGFACRLTALLLGWGEGRAETAAARQAMIEAFILIGLAFCVDLLVFLCREKGGFFVRANEWNGNQATRWLLNIDN